MRAFAVGVVLGFPPAGSATIPPRRARALAIAIAAPDQTTAGMSGGECAAGSPGGDASNIATRPVVPETSVGPGRAPESGPTEHHPGWAQSTSYVHAHYVPAGTDRGYVYGRPVGAALCPNKSGFIDERGLEEAQSLPPCRDCCRALALLSAPSQPGQQP